MACVSSQLPDDPPAKPNVLAVLVRYRFAFATRCSKCSRCSSLPARRLRALLLALPTPFCEKMRPSPYILGFETKQGPLFNRSRIATHRTAVPTPYLPYLVYQTFCCPAQSHSQLQLSRATKRITLAAHVWHCVSALLVSFQHPALRHILSAFLLFCRGTSSVSLRQEPSLVRSCMHASCRL